MISLKKEEEEKVQGYMRREIEQVPNGTGLDLLGEHRETCDFTREGLTIAISAPDISVDAIVLHDDPP